MKGFDKVNIVYGFIVTAGATIFGTYGFLFAGFLAMNIIDYLTGWCKAKFYHKNESSAIGSRGILKKVSYWVVIGIAFFMSQSFIYMGGMIGIDLAFVEFFGWFTLAAYLINEIRSILENLIEMSIKVPSFLVMGLDVAEKMLDVKAENQREEDGD